MDEQSREEGYMPGALNHMLIGLIPKSNKPNNFSQFKPISLCNLAYKIVTKIISNRLRPKLVEMVSKEQFGFLTNNQILDVVGITQ